MAICLCVALTAAIFALSAQPTSATPEFAIQTARDCAYCHVTAGGPLNADGEAFRNNSFRLPPTPANPVLFYGRWLRTTLLWAHILGVIAWLGGIISVFLVQRPQIAMAGIPRGYLRLAWPALTVVGITGVLLALGRVTGLATLTESRWGYLLWTKIAIFAALVGIAAVATFVVSPRLVKIADVARRLGRSQEQFKAQGRITVLYRGRVYDLTGSRLWPEGRHVRRHDAWQDLTASMAEAPHGPEVLKRFSLVEDAGEDKVPLPMRAYLVLTLVSIVLVLAVVLVVAAW